MWDVSGNSLKMAEGDFGIILPVTVKGTTLASGDSLRFTFKDKKNGTEILTKEYPNIEDNTVDLVLTETESLKLPVGKYVYSVDWYQEGNFMCNIVECGDLEVGDKA